MTYREELIQVAAVAVAMVEDLDMGVAQVVDETYRFTGVHENIREEISLERVVQDKKWGQQHHPVITWLAILAEEVGEVAREVEDQEDDSWAQLIIHHLASAEHAARAYLEEVGEDG